MTRPGAAALRVPAFSPRLLQAEQVREQTRRYLDQHGWDVAEDEKSWQEYQRRRMAVEYADDQW